MSVLAKDRPPAGTLVLIHGAWAGAWVWDKFQPLLETVGFQCIAVELPGTDGGAAASITQADYVHHVLAIVDRCCGQVWLIAHSGAGVIAADVAEARPHDICGIVFIAGMMLPSGMSFAELFESAPVSLGEDTVMRHLVWNEDGSACKVPTDIAIAAFFQDADENEARAAASRLTWQPRAGLNMRPTITNGRYGRIPRLYVEATEDKSVVIAAQRYMHKLTPGAEIASLKSDHAPQLSQPGRLLRAILPFLRNTAGFGGSNEVFKANYKRQPV